MIRHTILFDLDGTLTDPKEGITAAFAYALRRFGIEADPDSLTSVIGPPLKDSFMDLYGFSEERAIEAIREYRVSASFFHQTILLMLPVYFLVKMKPGIKELLAGLKEEDRELILATSKPELFTRRIMDHFGLSPYFAHICAAPMDESDGGKKENVIAAALRLASDPAGAVMVGDRSYDIIGAHKNAIPAIGVLYGYGSREELEKAGADRTADSVASLGELLHDTI